MGERFLVSMKVEHFQSGNKKGQHSKTLPERMKLEFIICAKNSVLNNPEMPVVGNAESSIGAAYPDHCLHNTKKRPRPRERRGL